MNDDYTADVTESTETLEEFCTTLSMSDKRVELLSAFSAMETQAGRTRATPTEFKSRYEAFAGAEPITPAAVK